MIDPVTGQAFPNATIPANRINPLATEALSFWAPANASGTSRNLTSAGSETADFDNISIKFDHAFTDVHRMSGRYSYAKELLFNPFGFQGSSVLPTFGQWNPRFRTSSGINMTSVFFFC